MPVIPSDLSNFPSQQGSNNSNNNSSSSQGQNTSNQPGQQSQKATASDHISKGPQIPESMPPKASREELEARAKELNK